MDSLENARKKLKEMGGSGVRLDPLSKSMKNPNSMRLAINAKCYDCVGRDADYGWRDRVRYCDITECSLHKLRQFKTKG